MRTVLVGSVAAGIVLITSAASIGHDQEINGFFHDIQLVIAGLRGLIEPIGALLLAGSLVLQTIIMKNQKKSKDDRIDQTEILKNQDRILAAIQNDINVVKDVQVTQALTSPNKEEKE